jgi:hypothetical protein
MKEVYFMQTKTNEAIRTAAEKHGVKLWQIADALGMNDGNFSRKLRHELPPEETERIIAIIARIAGEVRK